MIPGAGTGAGLLASFFAKAPDQLLRITAALHGADSVTPRLVTLATVTRAEILVRYHLAHDAHVTALLVSPPEGETELQDFDADLQNVLRGMVSVEGETLHTGEWAGRLERAGLETNARSLGRALVRLAATPCGLKIESLPKDAAGARWRIGRA